jgi:hypothetical protein
MNSVSNSDLDLLRATMDKLLLLTMDEDTIDEVDKDVPIGGMDINDDHFKTEGTPPPGGGCL